MISEHVIDPLRELIEKPKKDAKQLLIEFGLNSTAIMGLLTMFSQEPDLRTIGISVAAGAVLPVVNYIRKQKLNKRFLPSKLLLEGIEEMKAKRTEVLEQIGGITYNNLTEF